MKNLLSTFLVLIITYNTLSAQTNDSTKILDRFFMSSIQLGYINNRSEQLSAGLFIQASAEYRTPKGLFVRVNFDDFNSNYELRYPQGTINFLSGRVAFNELIGGLGYRYAYKKHNFLIALQSGIRFYGYPFIESSGSNLSVDTDNRTIGVFKYSIGYEYAIDIKSLVVVELFSSNVFEKKDFWEDHNGAFGFTVGINRTIF
ncbi:hypothetical protein [Algivirga pacifica]|uniref:Outer membrane protein beta-barrel domain-containing protein n=1 Tax=Algivirga pacifica TaxID=1162670 RepID=A0ABP9DBA8_9BACT